MTSNKRKPGNPTIHKHHFENNKGLGHESKRFTLRLADDDAGKLEQLAEQRGETRTECLRSLVQFALKNIS